MYTSVPLVAQLGIHNSFSCQVREERLPACPHTSLWSSPRNNSKGCHPGTSPADAQKPPKPNERGQQVALLELLNL